MGGGGQDEEDAEKVSGFWCVTAWVIVRMHTCVNASLTAG